MDDEEDSEQMTLRIGFYLTLHKEPKEVDQLDMVKQFFKKYEFVPLNKLTMY